MSQQEMYRKFWSLIDNNQSFAWLLENRPLLAHYTSIDSVEKILNSEELWLSNPLFMNDLEEMRF